jgi:murein DD-endopeptidase MepM/ murein hydrolase activator NlpD
MKKLTLQISMCLCLVSTTSINAQKNGASAFHTIGETQSSLSVVEPAAEELPEAASTDSINEQDMTTTDTTEVKPPMMVALPLEEIIINSPFGMRRDPMNRRKSRMHNGLDLKAKYEDVYSMFPGTVTAVSYSSSGGYYVTVDYGVCVCSFLHLSKIEVKNGQRVSAGQKIAVSGNTGQRTTGPHLHLSCKWSDTGKFFDPRILLRFITNELLKYSKLR